MDRQQNEKKKIPKVKENFTKLFPDIFANLKCSTYQFRRQFDVKRKWNRNYIDCLCVFHLRIKK